MSIMLMKMYGKNMTFIIINRRKFEEKKKKNFFDVVKDWKKKI